jgi:hypothetical protein
MIDVQAMKTFIACHVDDQDGVIYVVRNISEPSS